MSPGSLVVKRVILRPYDAAKMEEKTFVGNYHHLLRWQASSSYIRNLY
jgi:hypothetical protein